MPWLLLASSNVWCTLPAVRSCSPMCPPALLHLICLSCLLPYLSPRCRLLWCIKTAQSTHSHRQQQRSVENGVGREIRIPNLHGGSWSLSGTVNCHHCHAFLLFFWLVEATTTPIKSCSCQCTTKGVNNALMQVILLECLIR
jgi:hypothetical protein